MSEVEKADIFVGIIGERLGWAPTKCNEEDKEKLELIGWPDTAYSMTQIEMMSFLRKPSSKNKSLFLYRDPQFLKYVFITFMI